MSGIYIHIPFCKKACHYCNFHFSTNQNSKSSFIKALSKELRLRSFEYESNKIQTIYFGGGTPTVLQISELTSILDVVYEFYNVSETPEITLEANPDDLDLEKIVTLSKTKINRLSIGIQSFHEEELKLMNRAHNAQEAFDVLNRIQGLYDNFSLDLIFGLPNSTPESWQKNVEYASSFSWRKSFYHNFNLWINSVLGKKMGNSLLNGWNWKYNKGL